MKRFLINFIIVGIILFFGFSGIVFFFADYGPGESAVSRLFIAFLYFFIVGLLVHILCYPKKRRGFFLLWGVCAVFVLNLPTIISEGSRAIRESLGMLAVPFLGVFFSGLLIQRNKGFRRLLRAVLKVLGIIAEKYTA